MLWNGALPKRAELESLRKALVTQRRLPPKVLTFLRGLPRKSGSMDVLRTAVSLLGIYDPDAGDDSREANLRKAVRIQAQVPTLVAAWSRIRKGKAPIPPNPRLSLAGNLLYMLFGKKPSPLAEKAMDTGAHPARGPRAQRLDVRGARDGGDASDMYSGGRVGDRHAQGPASRRRERGGHADADGDRRRRTAPRRGSRTRSRRRSASWGSGTASTTPRIRGPTHLRRLSEQLGREAGELKWFEMSRIIERVVLAEKSLHANVDFYSASTYYSMGIDPDLYTPIFVVSRVSGWTAHILEQQAHNRLIRPRAEYQGSRQATWVPLDQR